MYLTYIHNIHACIALCACMHAYIILCTSSRGSGIINGIINATTKIIQENPLRLNENIVIICCCMAHVRRAKAAAIYAVATKLRRFALHVMQHLDSSA